MTETILLTLSTVVFTVSMRFEIAEIPSLLNQATQITDATKRNALYQQAEVIINQQAPLIPIYYQPLIKLLKPYVGGFPLHNPQDYVYSKELYIKAH